MSGAVERTSGVVEDLYVVDFCAAESPGHRELDQDCSLSSAVGDSSVGMERWGPLFASSAGSAVSLPPEGTEEVQESRSLDARLAVVLVNPYCA